MKSEGTGNVTSAALPTSRRSVVDSKSQKSGANFCGRWMCCWHGKEAKLKGLKQASVRDQLALKHPTYTCIFPYLHFSVVATDPVSEE